MLFSLRAPSNAAPSLAMSACAFCAGMCVCLSSKGSYSCGDRWKKQTARWRNICQRKGKLEACIMCRFTINYSYSWCFTPTCLCGIINKVYMHSFRPFSSTAKQIHREMLINSFVLLKTKQLYLNVPVLLSINVAHQFLFSTICTGYWWTTMCVCVWGQKY